MFIRIAKLEDYEVIEALAKDVQKMHIKWRPDIYTLESNMIPKEFFKPIVDNKTMYVAEEDNKVKGFIMYTEKEYNIDNQVKRITYAIDAIAVDKQYRGQGIGTKLIDKIKEIAKDNNVDAIELQVNAKNIAAKAMYEKYGFSDKSINMEINI